MDLPESFVPGFHNELEVKKMMYNDFGTTGLKVSKLSLGTAGFSSIYGNYTLDACRETLLKALKSGINYIDTGYWYGQNVAQQILGECLKLVPRNAYYIATKVGRYELDKENMFDFSMEKTKWCIENNLKTLGLDYVDVLQIHDIEFAPSIDYVIQNVLPVLVKAREKGLIKYIGVTGYPVSVLEEFIRKSPVKMDMLLSYARLTLVDNTLTQYLPYFKAEGLGIVNASGLAMGLLCDDGPPSWHPASQKIKDVCREAAGYCKKEDVKLSKLAVQYVYNESRIDTNLIGMNTPELVDENLEVLYKGLTKKEELVLNYIRENIFTKLAITHWE